jgi:hypothetical protein
VPVLQPGKRRPPRSRAVLWLWVIAVLLAVTIVSMLIVR